MKKSLNSTLHKAKSAKRDEFYTQLTDIEKELKHYKGHFHSLPKDQQEKILNYKLMVYFCAGTDSEKLKWFETINIAGERLTRQELRNAVYSGSWVSDAKRYFSKHGCAASALGKDYMTGAAIRQEYLETAIKWISDGDITNYMGRHQHDKTALPLWAHFKAIITWISATFTKKRAKYMKGVDWGILYKAYKDKVLNAKEIEVETARLIQDDDVQKKSGIYAYILTDDDKHLDIRSFSDSMKQKVYERQNGVCKICSKHFAIGEMEGDHIVPWKNGGKTIEENCQMLCKHCNRTKSGK